MEIFRRSLIAGTAGFASLLTFGPALALYPFCRQLRLGNFGPPEMEDWGRELQSRVRNTIEWKDGLSVNRGTLFGNTRQAFELVATNVIDLATVYGGIGVERSPDLAVLDDPRTQHIFATDIERAAALLGLIGRTPAEQGVLLLGATHVMQDIWVATDKKIASIKDLSGLKIRVGNQRQQIFAEAVGATATQMPFAEVSMALEQRVVDATVINPSVANLFKFRANTVVSLNAAQLMPQGYAMVMNGEVLKSADDRARRVFSAAGLQAGVRYTEIAGSRYNSAMESLQKQGTQLVSLSADHLKPARNIILKRADELYGEIGVSADVLDLIRS